MWVSQKTRWKMMMMEKKKKKRNHVLCCLDNLHALETCAWDPDGHPVGFERPNQILLSEQSQQTLQLLESALRVVNRNWPINSTRLTRAYLACQSQR